MKLFFKSASLVVLVMLLGQPCGRAETVSIVIATNAAPRVQFGAEKIVAALKAVKLDAVITPASPHDIQSVVKGFAPEKAGGRKIYIAPPEKIDGVREAFILNGMMVGDSRCVLANDDSGLLYGCLELAKRIRAAGKVPECPQIYDKPAMTLRGTCVAMQKTFILPGRKVYEYPYTPELFPWFYDKKLWTEYLDFLCANRMNTLYLWNGHPFASLVRLKDYPYAVEVSDDVFKKNQEQFRWLAQECDKRGIWLVQMFYNIFVSKPFAETNHISTQLSAPTPLVADYTRKSIAEFVKEFPNVGLMVCLGEALQGTGNQVEWCTKTILPGVLDGLKSRAGVSPAPAERSEANARADALTGPAGRLPYFEQPPVVIRTHAMNPEAIMPACFQVYSNLFTETKYNGESLTTYEPRGKAAQTHRNMAKLGPHLVNIHILSNLEPFRYGATEFIRKSVLASRDKLGASGIHLYPLSYWNWPYSPDIVQPSAEEKLTGKMPVPLLQWERDWIWFEAWARYAWNPDVNTNEDRAYWIGRLGDFYGCDTNAAGKILDAYNDAGEVAPMLIRRFGITEGNRQTLALGMTLDQLVNPMKYGAITELWESQAPAGERLDEFVRKELNHEPHVGETPDSLLGWSFPTNYIGSTRQYANDALGDLLEASPLVTKNRQEYDRLLNDTECIFQLEGFYSYKAYAAMSALRYNHTDDIKDMEYAEKALMMSYGFFMKLTAAAEPHYRYANSMQTSQRKIPVRGGENNVGTNYLWSHLLPFYKKELEDFQAKIAAERRAPARLDTNGQPLAEPVLGAPVAAWPSANFKLISTNAETYEVKLGAKVFADRKYTIEKLAPQLSGLTGIRFSHDAAKNGRYEPIEIELSEPSQVLVGYFNDVRDIWLQVPKLEFAAQADERGGVDTVLENAAVIQECLGVNLHAFRYEAGKQKLEFIGKGSFVILGVVPSSVKLEKRDAGKGTK